MHKKSYFIYILVLIICLITYSCCPKFISTAKIPKPELQHGWFCLQDIEVNKVRQPVECMTEDDARKLMMYIYLLEE